MMKKLLSSLFLMAGMAMAQSGIMGGSEGLHQVNATTLGQWNFMVGASGALTLDSWASARGGIYQVRGKDITGRKKKASASGIFYLGAGVLDNLDVGFGVPLYYDMSYASSYPSAFFNIRMGDVDLWAKYAPDIWGPNSMVKLAGQLDLYLPTGATGMGLRPRHAWYLREEGRTNPFTADEIVVGAMAIASVDFSKYKVPIDWNTNIGFVYAHRGSSTIVYGTGVDFKYSKLVVPFLEFSGEFRVECDRYPFDPVLDPMVLTPGVRFMGPYNIEVAVGLDVSVRALGNLSYDIKDEMDGVEDYKIYYTDRKGYKNEYGYKGAPTYALNGTLRWHFDAVEKIAKKIAHAMAPDSDNDGVVDPVDKCPDTPEGAFVDINGCPRDFDHDGIPDYMDQCPNTPKGFEIDEEGCSLDSDNDGVPNDMDKCPDTPKGIVVNQTGCPRDYDMDGIPDYLDQCPNNVRGVAVNRKGCPRYKKENLEELKKGIQFRTGSAELSTNSYATLDDIVVLMNKYSIVKLEIQGHTDNVGDSEKNKRLSQERAQAAVDYLIESGIAPNRIKAVGYGSERPIASNREFVGRARNRRVELIPFYSDGKGKDAPKVAPKVAPKAGVQNPAAPGAAGTNAAKDAAGSQKAGEHKARAVQKIYF